MTRSFAHWNARYIKNRVSLILWEKTHPNQPWFCKDTINFLGSYLQKEDTGFEWGSGRSTIWFSSRIKNIVSVEHDASWFSRVSEQLKEKEIHTVDYFHIEGESYYKKIREYSEDFDFVLVDGEFRDLCALEGIKKLKKGGILIIDNVNWFIPSKSNAPGSIRSFSGKSGEWESVWKILKTWRHYWVSNGVCDTAIFFKPYD